MSKRPDANQLAHLSYAAVTGDLEGLGRLLGEWQFDRSRLNEALITAAEHCSVASGHLHCVDALLSAGASVHASGASGLTFLMRACSLGQIQLVELALERGARVRDSDSLRKTPLHYAVDTTRGDNGDVVELLLEHGADPNACDNVGRSPLHYAASRGAYLSLKVLLQSHALVGLQDNARQTALDLAVASGQQRCVDCFRIRPVGSPMNEEKTAGRVLPREDAQTLLSSPGPDIGEELETKSGSSLSSQHALCDQATLHSTHFPQLLRRAQTEISLKRLELREEQTALAMAEQEVAALERELNWLQRETEAEQVINSTRLLALESQLETEVCLSRQSPLPPILTFQKKPVFFNEKLVLRRLQKDITALVQEIDQWQSSASPVITRAVDRWRTFASRIFPGCQTKVYGSVATGLHLPTSAVDLVLLNPHFSSAKTLRRLEESSRSEECITLAQVDANEFLPVLNAAIHSDGVEVRLRVTVMDGRHRGLKCVQLVRSLLDSVPALRSVYLTLKQLFHYSGADDPQTGGLSAYGLFLMVAESVKRECCKTTAENVFRFLSHFGLEFSYRTPIVHPPDLSIETAYPQLLLPDPTAPHSNIGSGVDLFFLTVSLM